MGHKMGRKRLNIMYKTQKFSIINIVHKRLHLTPIDRVNLKTVAITDGSESNENVTPFKPQ